MGGTELLEATKKCLSLFKGISGNKRMFLLTDGGVSDTLKVLSIANEIGKLEQTKIYSLGIG